MEPRPTENFYAVLIFADAAHTAWAHTVTQPGISRLPIILVVNAIDERIATWAGSANDNGANARKVAIALRGGALGAGMTAARGLGCSHVVLPVDCPPDVSGIAPPAAFPRNGQSLTDIANANPSAVVVGGLRTGRQEFFVRLASLLFRLETGVRITDLYGRWRIYPLDLLQWIAPDRCPSPTALLARAAWAGSAILQTPALLEITELAGNATAEPLQAADHPREAHPRRIFDRFKRLGWMAGEIAVHGLLLTRALIGLRHRRWPNGPAPIPLKPFWRGFWEWCNPLRAWRELRQGGASRAEMAAGIAVGVFIANLPTYGVQTLLALYAARRLHLHPVAVVAGSKASTPPVGPLLIAAAVWLGHLLLHRTPLAWKNVDPLHGHFMANALPLLLDWTAGALVIGALLGIFAFIAADFLFRAIERKQDAVARPGST